MSKAATARKRLYAHQALMEALLRAREEQLEVFAMNRRDWGYAEMPDTGNEPGGTTAGAEDDYDGHDPEECYTCEGTGESEIWDTHSVPCPCPCHELDRTDA